MHKGFCLILLAFLSLPTAHAEDAYSVKYSHENQAFEALYKHPEPGSLSPAVIYIHGAIVERGYKEIARQGYDVRDFLHALTDSGYAAIVPLRGTATDAEALLGIQGALDFLKDQSDIETDKIAIMGFSKGGRLALESLDKNYYQAAVIMSPGISGFSENLSDLPPLLLTAGQRDPASIVKAVESFCDNIAEFKNPVECRTDYPGNHQWFWKVRPDHWQDVETFLGRHLTSKEEN